MLSAAAPASRAAPASGGTYGTGSPVRPKLRAASVSPAITAPITLPVRNTMTPSQRSIRSTCRRVVPTRRSSASSRARWLMSMTRVLATATAT